MRYDPLRRLASDLRDQFVITVVVQESDTFSFGYYRSQQVGQADRAVIRTAVWSSPHSDGKSLARRQAFRLAAPCCDLAVLATLIARHLGHAAIIRRGWSSAKWDGVSAYTTNRIIQRNAPDVGGFAAAVARAADTRLPATHHQLPFRPAAARARGDRLSRRPRPVERRLPGWDTGRVHRLGRRPARRPGSRPRRSGADLRATRLAGPARRGRIDPLPDLAARLGTFLDGYGLPDRKAILPELQRCALDEEPSSPWLRATLPDLGRRL